ncbi:hypothetical protein SAMN05192545_2887 [Maribacter dokdonensis]|uniref:Uncharacterized protein n=1 Tax=Maribacter dokdonensis TaxID=320912 RepID=A0ABY0UTG2_9FLAO|nr:hypothetical protein [Maribacter dokdonensis]SDT15312.1 hypothetical protein SAMN05192545_2887 [Maribacter dokdonensis]
MIQRLCNTGNEHYIDTFTQVAILEASQLPYFSHLSTDDKVEQLITNLPDSAQVLITDLLPNNISVLHTPRFSSAGTLHNTAVSFLITPQDKNLQALLNTYQNKEVVVLVSKHNTSHLYGTAAQPLLFSFSEANSPAPEQQKGYAISINGDGYGTSKLYEEVVFNIYSRGLAFELAQSI